MDSNRKEQSNLMSENRGFYSTLIATFTAVFIAELGDKTQLATLILTAETGHPLTVFLAASIALILTSLIGVLIGRYLAKLLQPFIFNRLAAILMIIISIFMFYKVYSTIKPLAL